MKKLAAAIRALCAAIIEFTDPTITLEVKRVAMKNPRTRLILILGLVLVLAVIAVLPSLWATPSPTVTSSPARRDLRHDLLDVLHELDFVQVGPIDALAQCIVGIAPGRLADEVRWITRIERAGNLDRGGRLFDV